MKITIVSVFMILMATTQAMAQFELKDGPVISGGGLPTVKEASGKASVMLFSDSSLVSVEGDAAKLLFNSLEVQIMIPIYSTSEIKTLESTSCTKNGEDYFCMINVNRKALKSAN